MDCGIDFQTPAIVTDMLSYIGLGQPEKETNTPSTVGLDKDENEIAARDAAILESTKKLSYGVCLPAGCSPVKDNGEAAAKKEMKFSGCNPQNCRMNAGICIDCTYCHIHCICDSNSNGRERLSPNRLSNRNKQALLAHADAGTGSSRYTCSTPETTKPQQQELRKSPSLMSDGSSDGSTGIRKKRSSKGSSPSKSFILKNDKKSGGKNNTRRYDMEDDGVNLYLTDRLLKEHTNRSNRSYRSSGESSHSQHSYMSYNSNKTGSSSRRRYNFGDEDENNVYQQESTRRTTRRGHRRTTSSGTNISRKSNTSFSLLRGKKKQDTKKNESDDPIIGKTFSFDSGNSHSSGIGSAYSAAPTRSSATTTRRTNSQRGGGSLSSSSRSYLDGSDVEAEAVEPKKSWFRRRFEPKA